MDFDAVSFLIYGLPLLLAIPMHEAAHGFVADRCGDPTAREAGRVSFNPIIHIDPMGTILLPVSMIMAGLPFVFGWAKPVPVNFRRLRHKRRDTILVAGAGPAINLVLAVLSAFALRYVVADANLQGLSEMPWWGKMLEFSLLLNVVLAVFNMLPLLPLDGGRILNAALPPKLAEKHTKSERYGMVAILMIIVLPPLFGMLLDKQINLIQYIILPPVIWLTDLIVALAGIA